MTGPVASSRRDALVVRACLSAVALQAAPPVLIAWGGYGSTAAADAAVVAVSSPVLLGVVAFGIVIAVALRQPGLEPPSDPPRGTVDERGGAVATGPLDAVVLQGPVRRGDPATPVRPRLRWAALAALVAPAVTAAAVVVDGGATPGAASLSGAMDDGSAVWAFVLLVVQAGLVELRAPVAFAVAWFALARASRPVSPRRRPRWPEARTRRPSRDRPTSRRRSSRRGPR